MGEVAKAFSPTRTERRAILAVGEAISQLQLEGGEILREVKLRLGIAPEIEVAYDPQRDKIVILERPAPAAEAPASPSPPAG